MAIGSAGEVRSSLLSSTRLSKGLAALLVLGYLLSQLLPASVDVLALIPGRTIPFVWNLITAAYFEHSLIGLVFSVSGVLWFGRVLEPIWGPRGLIKFIAFVNFFTSICTFVLAIFLYLVTQQGSYLYAPISGFSAVLAGFLVAIKQLSPDQMFYGLGLRAKWLPLIFVTGSIIVGLVLPDAVVFVPFITIGTYISWLYLRFFQPRTEAAHVRGDPGDDFAFVTFFPDFARPVLHPIAKVCGKLFCSRRAQNVASREEHLVNDKPLPGSDPVEASRRRERGARALEERLTVVGSTDEHEQLVKGPEDNV